MVRFLFVGSLLLIWINARAQEQILKRQYTQKFEPDTVLYQVNEYPTSYGVLALFKPDEIIMTRKLDPAVSQNIVDFRIQVLDSAHQF